MSESTQGLIEQDDAGWYGRPNDAGEGKGDESEFL
jgi:hypothetical protein